MKNDLKNQPKIVKKLVLGGPWGCPGTFPEPVGTIFETWRRFLKNLSRSGHVPEPIRGPSRVQPGPKNRQKTDLWPKKRPRGASPGAFFTDLLCRHRFRSIFCPMLDRFLSDFGSIFLFNLPLKTYQKCPEALYFFSTFCPKRGGGYAACCALDNDSYTAKIQKRIFE